jgi:hypothetical protein
MLTGACSHLSTYSSTHLQSGVSAQRSHQQNPIEVIEEALDVEV